MAFLACTLRYIDTLVSDDGDFIYKRSHMDSSNEVQLARGLHAYLFDDRLFDPSSDETIFDARLTSFKWQLESFERPNIEISFRNRWKLRHYQFLYYDAIMHQEGNIFPNAQGLRYQALGISGGRHRHEFLFENGCFVVLAKGIEFVSKKFEER